METYIFSEGKRELVAQKRMRRHISRDTYIERERRTQAQERRRIPMRRLVKEWSSSPYEARKQLGGLKGRRATSFCSAIIWIPNELSSSLVQKSFESVGIMSPCNGTVTAFNVNRLFPAFEKFIPFSSTT